MAPMMCPICSVQEQDKALDQILHEKLKGVPHDVAERVVATLAARYLDTCKYSECILCEVDSEINQHYIGNTVPKVYQTKSSLQRKEYIEKHIQQNNYAATCRSPSQIFETSKDMAKTIATKSNFPNASHTSSFVSQAPKSRSQGLPKLNIKGEKVKELSVIYNETSTKSNVSLPQIHTNTAHAQTQKAAMSSIHHKQCQNSAFTPKKFTTVPLKTMHTLNVSFQTPTYTLPYLPAPPKAPKSSSSSSTRRLRQQPWRQ